MNLLGLCNILITVQTVNVGHSMSNFQGIKVGVPQGSILGPLLFIM